MVKQQQQLIDTFINEIYTKPPKKIYGTNKTLLIFIDETWSVDLLYVSTLKKNVGVSLNNKFQTRVSSNFLLKKSQFYVTFNYLECRRKKTIILLTGGINIHQDTEIRYLSHDRFRSSTIFIRKDGCFGVSFNKRDSRWKQTVFLVVVGNCCTWPRGFGWYRPRFFSNFHLKNCQIFASFYNFESRCKNTVTLLIVDSRVHRGTKIWYLSNASLRSSKTFNRTNGLFGVSITNLDSRWKQTVFLVVVCKRYSRDMNFR